MDRSSAMEVDDATPPKEEVNMANAVDLSDSDEEEVVEDITRDFAPPDADVQVRSLFLAFSVWSDAACRIRTLHSKRNSTSFSFLNHSLRSYLDPIW